MRLSWATKLKPSVMCDLLEVSLKEKYLDYTLLWKKVHKLRGSEPMSYFAYNFIGQEFRKDFAGWFIKAGASTSKRLFHSNGISTPCFLLL
jgi:hypothetical protein